MFVRRCMPVLLACCVHGGCGGHAKHPAVEPDGGVHDASTQDVATHDDDASTSQGDASPAGAADASSESDAQPAVPARTGLTVRVLYGNGDPAADIPVHLSFVDGTLRETLRTDVGGEVHTDQAPELVTVDRSRVLFEPGIDLVTYTGVREGDVLTVLLREPTLTTTLTWYTVGALPAAPPEGVYVLQGGHRSCMINEETRGGLGISGNRACLGPVNSFLLSLRTPALGPGTIMRPSFAALHDVPLTSPPSELRFGALLPADTVAVTVSGQPASRNVYIHRVEMVRGNTWIEAQPTAPQSLAYYATGALGELHTTAELATAAGHFMLRKRTPYATRIELDGAPTVRLPPEPRLSPAGGAGARRVDVVPSASDIDVARVGISFTVAAATQAANPQIGFWSVLLAPNATSTALPLLPDTVDGYPPGMADAVVSRWDVHASDELAGYDEFRTEPLRWDGELGNPLRSTSSAVTAWLDRGYR